MKTFAAVVTIDDFGESKFCSCGKVALSYSCWCRDCFNAYHRDYYHHVLKKKGGGKQHRVQEGEYQQEVGREVIPKGMKRCSSCGKIKKRTAFSKNKSHKDGLDNLCRSCRASYTYEYLRTEKGKRVIKKYRQSQKGKEALMRAQKKFKSKQELSSYQRNRMEVTETLNSFYAEHGGEDFQFTCEEQINRFVTEMIRMWRKTLETVARQYGIKRKFTQTWYAVNRKQIREYIELTLSLNIGELTGKYGFAPILAEEKETWEWIFEFFMADPDKVEWTPKIEFKKRTVYFEGVRNMTYFGAEFLKKRIWQREREYGDWNERVGKLYSSFSEKWSQQEFEKFMIERTVKYEGIQ